METLFEKSVSMFHYDKGHGTLKGKIGNNTNSSLPSHTLVILDPLDSLVLCVSEFL